MAGDGMMAGFGVTSAIDDAPGHAVDAARQMLGDSASNAIGQPLMSHLPPLLRRTFGSLRIDVQSPLELDVDDEAIRGLCLQPIRDAQRRLAGYLLGLRAANPAGFRQAPAPVEVERMATPEGRSLKASTNELIRRTLAECNGEVGRAARRLGIARSTLYRRLKQVENHPAGGSA
jgi:hypothetical protein